MSAVIKDQKNKLSIPIYLDYSSTTPVDERVAKKMSECLTKEGTFGNPASRSHPYGWDSEKLIDECFDAFDSFIKKIHNKDVKDKNKYFKALSLELANVASDLVKKFNSL